MAESPQPYPRHGGYKLTGVKVTDQTLFTGSYTLDIVLEYLGLKCVGKKIHQALFMQGDTTAKVRQLKEQCQLLSQLRHPNVAMFFGLYFQESPFLVMEYLPYSLASCTEQYGALPDEISYSILHDVALGLSYLHNHPPTIVHGELSANNILLCPNMTAKISYTGVPKLLRLTPPETLYMAKTDGTIHYMAPELVLLATNDLQHDTSVDVFSYGVMMVQTINGKLPDQLTCAANGDTAISGTTSWNTDYGESVSQDHPLKNLIIRCTEQNPQLRPDTDELVKLLAERKAELSGIFVNRLEMLLKLKMSRKLTKSQQSWETLEEEMRHKKQQVILQQEEIDKLSTENKLFKQQLKSDDEVMGEIISNLQQRSLCDDKNDSVIPVENDKAKPEIERPVNHKLEQRAESPKIYGPKPRVMPRSKKPAQEEQIVSD